MVDTQENLIKAIIEMRIRPVLQAHGGDIVFCGFKDGVVSVQLQGACDGCPNALQTLHEQVEDFLKVVVPDVQSVQDINLKQKE